MKKILSDESLRRALSALAPNPPRRCTEAERAQRAAQLANSTDWMDTALAESVDEALHTPWILARGQPRFGKACDHRLAQGLSLKCPFTHGGSASTPRQS